MTEENILQKFYRKHILGIDNEDEVDTEDIIIIRPATNDEITEAEKRGDLD